MLLWMIWGIPSFFNVVFYADVWSLITIPAINKQIYYTDPTLIHFYDLVLNNSVVDLFQYYKFPVFM